MLYQRKGNNIFYGLCQLQFSLDWQMFSFAFVARLFNAFVGINEPSLPFSGDLNIDPQYKILGLVILYVSSTWIASIVKLFLKGCQFKLKASIWRDLSEIAYKKIMHQNYEFFLDSNKNDISKTLLINIDRVSEMVVLPLLQLISGFFVVIFISVAVLTIAKKFALSLIISMKLYSLLLIFLS